MQLTLSDDIKQEISIDLTGKCTTSIRATATIFGLSDSTLVESFKTALGSLPTKLAQNLVEQGFEPARFSESGVPDLALPVIAFYYAVEAGRRCTKEAKAVLQLFATVGARKCLQQVKGWSQVAPVEKPTAFLMPEIPKSVLARKLVNNQAVKTGLQHQLVFREAYAELDYRFGYNINTKKCKGTKLARIEEDGQLDNLIAIMQMLWTDNKPTT
jgi:hypothetical protein